METLLLLLALWLLRYARPTLFLIALAMSIGARAQLLTNTAALSIMNGAEVFVNGDLHDDGPGEILNNGVLHLTGDLTHDGSGTCFGGSTGEVVLDGGAQSISGSAPIIFHHLTLGGTGTKTLQRDVAVGGTALVPAGVLRLNDRVLRLNAHTLTVRNAGNGAIQRTTGHIESETDPLAGYGTLRWNIGQSAAVGDVYVFPFGNSASGDYLPVSITFNSSGMGLTGWLALGTYPTNPFATPNNRPLPTGLSVLTDIAGNENAPNVLDRWWVMATGGYSQAPTADLRFTYRDSEWNSGTNLIAEPTLMLQDLWNGSWQNPPSMVDPVTNTLLTTGRTLRNGPWTASAMGVPLPVELLSFTGERVNAHEVQLVWTTATEHDNAGFEVWRMIEGEAEFAEVGWVEGRGQSLEITTYAFTDLNPAEKISYYRLKQVDTDGQFTWSPVVAVVGGGHGPELVAFPNPATDQLMLQGLPETTSRIDLLDATGRVVRSWGALAQLAGLGDLPRGMYTLVASGAHDCRSTRILLH